jgi:hypothetical protein
LQHLLVAAQRAVRADSLRGRSNDSLRDRSN